MDPIQTINTQQFKRSVQQTDVDSSPKTSKARDIQLREASRKLEASFLTQMVKALEKTVPKSGLTGSRNTLASMLFSTVMGDALAQANPTGLSNMFYHSLQEKNEITVSPDLSGEMYWNALKSIETIDQWKDNE